MYETKDERILVRTGLCLLRVLFLLSVLATIFAACAGRIDEMRTMGVYVAVTGTILAVRQFRCMLQFGSYRDTPFTYELLFHAYSLPAMFGVLTVIVR